MHRTYIEMLASFYTKNNVNKWVFLAIFFYIYINKRSFSLCFHSLLLSYQQWFYDFVQYGTLLCCMRSTASNCCIWCMYSLPLHISNINKFSRMLSQTMMLFIYQLASCKWNQRLIFVGKQNVIQKNNTNWMFHTIGNVIFKLTVILMITAG